MTILMTPENALKTLHDEKSHTRRLEKPGDYGWMVGVLHDKDQHGRPKPSFSTVHSANHRVRWERDKTYAIAPGRGKMAMWYTTDDNGRTTIADDAVWKAACFHAGYAQPTAEAVKQFMRDHDWCELRIRILAISHERVDDISVPDCIKEGIGWRDPVTDKIRHGEEVIYAFRDLWNSINKKAPYRFNDGPLVWVLQYERVKPWEAKDDR